MKKLQTTFPRTLTCPLTAMFPPTMSTFPTFPETTIILDTLAYEPMTLPRTSRDWTPEAMIPDSWEPLPMKKGVTMLPRTLTCPLAAMLPPTRSTLPTFPMAAKMFVTLAYEPMTFPRTSMFAVVGSVKLAIPDSWEPLPMKKGATTLPRVFNCPLAAMLPPARSTLPTFPEDAVMFVTLAYAPITLPRTSRFATKGSDVSRPVSWEPLPRKKFPTTLPRTLT